MQLLQQWVSSYKQFHTRYVIQQRRKYEYPINRYYAHLIDPFFTKIAYDLKLSANTVTTLAMMSGVLSGLSLYYNYLILGAILLQLHHFLDGADGNLARLTNSCTSFGQKYDYFSDQLVRVVLFSCVAFYGDTPLWLSISFLLVLFLDVCIVDFIIVPCSKKRKLWRSQWKQNFLDKGIIIGLDHFMIFFMISLAAVFNHLTWIIYIVLILKPIDLLYRSIECAFGKNCNYF